jgi:predicted membrane protein
LWAFPVHLITPALIYKSRYLKFSIYYFLFWSIFLTLFLIGWNFMPQQFHIAFIPILLMMIMRSYRRYQKNKRTYEQYVERRKQ